MRWLVDEGIGFDRDGESDVHRLGRRARSGDRHSREDRRADAPNAGAECRTRRREERRLAAASTAWDDALADRIAAVNLFMDESKDRRRRQIEGYRTQYGTCRADGPFDVENALRGAVDDDVRARRAARVASRWRRRCRRRCSS